MKLSKLIFRAIFLVAFISILVVISSSIYFQYNNFNKEKHDLEEEFRTQNQELLKNEIDKVMNFIEYKQNKNYEDVKKRLINRVDSAYDIAMSIYTENKNRLSDEEIKKLIVLTLKNISFEHSRDYYFINSNSGEAVLFNTQSKLGKHVNVWNLRNKDGKYFVQEQASIARKLNSGFLRNYFPKPDKNDDVQYPKLTYVKLFEPYDWHIGMGEYIDDMQERLKEELLEWVASVRFGSQGYIYVNTLDGHALVFNGQKLAKPKYWAQNPVFQKEVDAALNKDDHYFYYKFRKLDSVEKHNKMGYAIFFNDYQWLIGTGVYIDEIEYKVNKKRDELTQSITYQIIMVLLISCILIAIVFLISKKIENFLDTSINYLKYAFEKASKEYFEVDTQKITFNEFQVLAKSLNKTLKSREEVQKKLKNYLKIVDANVIIFTLDPNGYILEVSKALCKLSHYTRDELIGQHFTILYDIKSATVNFREVWRYIKRVNGWSGEIQNVDKNGNTYWLKAYIHSNFKNDQVVEYTIIAEDISDKKRVEYLSITDGLTQLYNRRYFNERIITEINRVKRAKGYVALMMIDVDHFKMYNDTYGHLEGDKVLKDVAEVLKNFTNRSSDYAFRMGGEEFGVIFECETQHHAEAFANKIKDSIEQLQILHKHSNTNYLTISIGVVVKRYDEIINSDELYKQADSALYQAKSLGRNSVVIIG